VIKYTVTLLAASLLTGRNHQIRQHCKQIGHPIVNDPIHSGKCDLDKLLNEFLLKKKNSKAETTEAATTTASTDSSKKPKVSQLTSIIQTNSCDMFLHCYSFEIAIPPSHFWVRCVLGLTEFESWKDTERITSSKQPPSSSLSTTGPKTQSTGSETASLETPYSVLFSSISHWCYTLRLFNCPEHIISILSLTSIKLLSRPFWEELCSTATIDCVSSRLKDDSFVSGEETLWNKVLNCDQPSKVIKVDDSINQV